MNMDYDEVEAPAPESATLRDQFAMAALTGLLMRREITSSPAGFANAAYKYADDMLAARETKP